MSPASLDLIARLQWVCACCESVRLSAAKPGECSDCGSEDWDNALDLAGRDTDLCIVVHE